MKKIIIIAIMALVSCFANAQTISKLTCYSTLCEFDNGQVEKCSVKITINDNRNSSTILVKNIRTNETVIRYVIKTIDEFTDRSEGREGYVLDGLITNLSEEPTYCKAILGHDMVNDEVVLVFQSIGVMFRNLKDAKYE